MCYLKQKTQIADHAFKEMQLKLASQWFGDDGKLKNSVNK